MIRKKLVFSNFFGYGGKGLFRVGLNRTLTVNQFIAIAKFRERYLFFSKALGCLQASIKMFNSLLIG